LSEGGEGGLEVQRAGLIVVGADFFDRDGFRVGHDDEWGRGIVSERVSEGVKVNVCHVFVRCFERRGLQERKKEALFSLLQVLFLE
jgi:hypothetical protein